MSIPEITSLIWSIAGLVAVVVLSVLLFRPPSWVRNGFADWRKSGRAFKRLKLGKLELEAEESTLQESANEADESPGLSKASKSEEETLEEQVTGRDEKEDTFGSAVVLLEKGEYKSGMGLLKKFSEAEDYDNPEGLMAFGQYLAFNSGADDAVLDLERNAQQNPANSRVRYWLGVVYNKMDRIEAGLSELRAAVEHADDDVHRAEVCTELSNILARRSRSDEARTVLRDALDEVTSPKAQAHVYRALAAFFKAGDISSRNLEFPTWEQAMVLNPGDRGLRFDLAVAYSEAGHNGMALYHYRELINRIPDHASALNNAGVSAQKMKLYRTGVGYYQRAADEGETLAMSNLAHQLIDAGFATEAERLILRAEGAEETHENVAKARAKLVDQARNEEKQLLDLTEHANRLLDWKRRAARAYLRENNVDIKGTYTGTPGELELQSETNGIITGSYGHQHARRSLTGRVIGCVLFFRWVEVKSSDAAALGMYAQPRSGAGLLIFEESKAEGVSAEGIEALEEVGAKDIKEWQLERTEPVE